MKHRLTHLACGIIACWTLASCGNASDTTSDDVGTIQNNLELADTGGYAMSDEVARFGRVDLDEIDIDPNLIVPLPDEMSDFDSELATLSDQTDSSFARPETGAADPSTNPTDLPAYDGLLRGKWKQLGPRIGVFHGKWATKNGAVVGHLRGIYGVNRAGQRVFFGKYISRNGAFMGILKGRYADGHFKGRYFDKHGVRGILWGAYGDNVTCARSDASDQTGDPSTAARAADPTTDVRCKAPGRGFFVGKWRALTNVARACAADDQCGVGAYCRLPNGACLLDDASAASTAARDDSSRPRPLGRCVHKPRACIELLAPVCGCDGQTYTNECHAMAAGASIAHVGACRPVSQPVFCSANTDCRAGQFCLMPDGQCGRDPSILAGQSNASGAAAPPIAGRCVDKPQACAAVAAPVCGCDKQTYGSSCDAYAAGTSVAHPGRCDDTIACRANSDCPSDAFCDLCPSACPDGANCIQACGEPVCKPLVRRDDNSADPAASNARNASGSNGN